jgi:hypothetical protein
MMNDLQRWLDREPFVPFRIVLTSGTTYDVTSSLQLVVEQTKMTYYYAASDGEAVLRVNQLAAIETLKPNQRPARSAADP